MTDADPKLIEDLVLANHILAMHGVVDGFGHVSARRGDNPEHFLLAASMAPQLVQRGDLMTLGPDGEPIDKADQRKAPLERYIHSEIYRARPDVMAVVHSHSPAMIPFGVTQTPLRPTYHMASFLGAGAPVFEIREAGGPATDMLVRSRDLGAALAVVLAGHTVCLMRGHGSVVVGASISNAVVNAVYAQQGAAIQLQALSLGPVTYLNAEEAAGATAVNELMAFKSWDLWVREARGRAPV